MKLKEAIWIIIAILLFWIIIGITYNSETESLQLNLQLSLLIIPALIILTNIFAKEIVAPRYSTKIEHSIWKFQRWGWYERAHFKKPIPIGLILPPLVSFLALGFLKPFLFLQYNAKNDSARRLLKKQGTRRAERKMDLNEVDSAFISVWGFYSLIILAIIGELLTYNFNIQLGTQLTKYSIFYGAWNLLPLGNLDGAKTLFGSPVSYSLLLIFYAIFLILTFIF